MESVQIGNFQIGPGHPCFIIAEAGVNHNGDMNVAMQLIDAAQQAGADAIKFQSFITEDLVTANTIKAKYQENNTKIVGTQYDMLKGLELTPAQHGELKAYCQKKRISYLCTPYEHKSVDAIDKIGVTAFKIASTDTTNIPLLMHIARKKRPVILSTGMCSLGEVELAVNTLKKSGLRNKIVILQCTSEYPAPMAEINLRAMKTMEQAFNCPVGFSDHTPGIGASPWAVAIGACVVEKHFTLDCTMPGPDHLASIEPQELALLVSTVRDVEMTLGDGIKRPMASEIDNKEKMQKSLVARTNIGVGQKITEQNITCKRPGSGLTPVWFSRVVGKIVSKDIDKDSLLTINDIDWT